MAMMAVIPAAGTAAACSIVTFAGFGTKNTRAVQELIDLGAEEKNIVVIDTSEERLKRAKSAKSEFYTRLAFQSAKSRRKRRERGPAAGDQLGVPAQQGPG